MSLPFLLTSLVSSYQLISLHEPILQRYGGNGGFEFRVKDIPGTSYVGFRFSVNKPLPGIKAGDYNVDVVEKVDGYWVYKAPDVRVRSWDTLHYWVHQMVNGMSYTLTDRTWKPPDRLELAFEDHFDTLDLTKWEHEVTASGGGNWEFQIYSENPNNSYVRDNTLFIRPTLTADMFGEDFLYNGVLNMTEAFGKCTQSQFAGCVRDTQEGRVINPAMSARLFSKFSFRYGRAEIIAKMPRGDWLWPAMWFLPQNWKYGIWPRSGEIDLVEARGNRNYGDIGIQAMGSTLHWGPIWNINGFLKTTQEKHAKPKWTYADGFHKYVLDWDSTHIRTYVDDDLVLNVPTPTKGYWKFGNFSGDDIWSTGGLDAPFDKEFYLILNVAVGGTNTYFPDGVENKPYPKPWKNPSPLASREFWEAKDHWYPTWYGEDAAMQVKSVKIWKKID